MKKKGLIICILVISTFLSVSSNVQADIAPPLQPPGANPGLLNFEQTDIEMAIESVTFYVEESGRLYYPSTSADTVNCHVTATYAMANPNPDDTTLDVVFPLMNIEGYGDGRFNYPEIQNFSVSANDELLTWETVTTPNPDNPDEEPVKWAQFEVKFLSGELTFIDISYDVQSTGYFPIAAFSFILETGAAWAGPIGDAYITLVLPYEANEGNVLLGNDVYYGLGGENNPNPEFNENKVIWHWINLEPTREDNWAIEIFAPHIWKK